MPKERQTCTRCSMRRQKCDRNVPCNRCVKRGEPDRCTREWPTDGYDPKKHRIYPRPDKGDTHSPIASAGHGNDFEAGPQSVQQSRAGVQPALRSSEASSDSRLSRDLSAVSLPGKRPIEQDKDTSVLEFLTWGRDNLADYQVKSFDLIGKEPCLNNQPPPCPEQEYSNGFGNSNAQQISFLQLLLPRGEQIFHLVDYHISTVLWYHACFHGETFRKELQAQCLNPNGLQIANTDMRWVALLFAIMSATMACADNNITVSWGFHNQEKHKLMRQWYKASLTCLNLADYMWRHHINSVSAICVLTLSGHILGFSNTQSTLHGAALKIAQGLGLQRLGPEADESILNDQDLTPARREKIIRREIGRRTWSQLCNQDWFSIPFSEMYTIQRTHFSTSKPQHIDEHTLLPVPAHEPSWTSFVRCLNDIARILPQAHDALTSANTLSTKYEQILYYDAKMKALQTKGVPSFLQMTEPLRPGWPEWITWARRSLRICFAHKTIMIHRSFLGKSLSDSNFEQTRKTCMEASKIILKEARQAQDGSDGPLLWIDQAFMVAAGITLSLDTFHRKSTHPEFEEHRKCVQIAVNMLSKFENSMIAIRGVRLLTSLLAEQARLSAERSMDSYNKNKRAHEDDTSPTPGSGDPANTPNFMNVANGASFTNAMKRPKFDVPKFLENFVGGDKSSNTPGASTSYASNNDIATPTNPNGNGDMILGSGRLGNVLIQQQASDKLPPQSPVTSGMLDSSIQSAGFDAIGTMDTGYAYEAFEQIFPPHAGMSNSFLFEDLLNFEV